MVSRVRLKRRVRLAVATTEPLVLFATTKVLTAAQLQLMAPRISGRWNRMVWDTLRPIVNPRP